MVVATKEPVQDQLEEIPVLDEADQLLLDTERILIEKGWYQGGLEGPGGSVCLVGALNTAVLGYASVWNGRPYNHDWWLKREPAIRKLRRITGMHPAVYNDAKAKTVEDVLNVLRKARSH